MDAASGPAAFFLDAHYYSGGLRVARLGTDPTRPSWAPDASTGLVGFRDEVRLEDDDAVVEFARFRLAGRDLSWIGVYRRAVDARLGDRGNHAGVGVWLLEQDVRDPRALLKGLDSLAAHVADNGPEAAGLDADTFSSGEYLPRCIRPRADLPASLAGWPFSAHLSPDTLLFLAEGSDADRLDRAAEQLLRCSVLPAPGPEVARAIILMRASAAAGEAGAGRLEPLRRGVASDVMDGLPPALAELRQQFMALDQSARTARDESARAESALTEAQAELSRAAERVAMLEAQVADSDILSRLGKIDSGINFLDSAAQRTENALEQLRREVGRVGSTITNERRGSRLHELGAASPARPATSSPRSTETAGSSRLQIAGTEMSLVEVVLGVVLIVVILVLGYFIVRHFS